MVTTSGSAKSQCHGDDDDDEEGTENEMEEEEVTQNTVSAAYAREM